MQGCRTHQRGCQTWVRLMFRKTQEIVSEHYYPLSCSSCRYILLLCSKLSIILIPAKISYISKQLQTISPHFLWLKMDSISISFWNVKGLHCPLFGCKLIINDFVEKIQKYDISIVAETWGCDHDHNITGYKLIEIKPNKR